MTERIVAPRLADIIEAIERIRHVLDGVTLEAFEQNWEKRWLVERGIEIISEASRHLTDDPGVRALEAFPSPVRTLDARVHSLSLISDRSAASAIGGSVLEPAGVRPSLPW